MSGARVEPNGRGRFQGMLQILDYNRGFYFFSMTGAVLALVAAGWLRPPLAGIVILAGFITLLWTVVSLCVAHYVYDRSTLYDLRWIRKRLPETCDWVNIHSGLDETTELLLPLFAIGNREILDIYDEHEMTEPSIARARKVSGAQFPAMRTSFRSLPLMAESADAVFVIFSAHEIRDTESRIAFFKEVARVLRAQGEVVVIEHLRDIANLLAFGPGFLHFFSRREWLRTFDAAAFRVTDEFPITPFVRVLVLRHQECP